MPEPLLTTQRLSNHFGMVCTARDLDLRFEPGVLTSIIGPNGAGKSTLINLLTGHLPVQAGRIRFRGRDITRLPIHKRVRMGICRSFQVVNVFPELTVAQNVMIPVLARTGEGRGTRSGASRGRPRPRGRRRRSSRWSPCFRSATRPPPRSPTGTCASWRSAWRCAAAPTLLFLDEPTAGMNPVERVRLLENIRELARRGRTTFVVVEHDMDVVFSLSERILVLHRGEILCDGTPAQVRADTKAGKCTWATTCLISSGTRRSEPVILEAVNVDTYYGTSHILQEVSLSVGEGEVVALLGRNGGGKTTTLRSIMGLSRRSGGRSGCAGRRSPAPRRTRSPTWGGVYVPDDLRIFPDLTAEENLEIARRLSRRQGYWNRERVYELPEARGSRPGEGDQPVGRGEEDAGDRTGADGEPVPDPAGRAVRGARAWWWRTWWKCSAGSTGRG